MTSGRQKTMPDLTVRVESMLSSGLSIFWTTQIGWAAPLSRLIKAWAEIHRIPESAITLTDAEGQGFDLQQTPKELCWPDPAHVFSVPVDNAFAEQEAESPKQENRPKVKRKAVAKAAVGLKAKKFSMAKGAIRGPTGVIKQEMRDIQAKEQALVASHSAPAPVPGPNDRIRYRKQNPKKSGSLAFARYEKYKSARSPKEALQLGAASGDLSYDWRHGFFWRVPN